MDRIDFDDLDKGGGHFVDDFTNHGHITVNTFNKNHIINNKPPRVK